MHFKINANRTVPIFITSVVMCSAIVSRTCTSVCAQKDRNYTMNAKNERNKYNLSKNTQCNGKNFFLFFLRLD